MHPPAKITAGDTVRWLTELPNYSPKDYSLSWSFRGKTSLDVDAAVNNGQFWTIINGSQSNSLIGSYSYQAYVTDGDDNRTTVLNGSIEVMPNLATVTGEFDGRSPAEQMLDLVNSAIAALMTDNVKAYRIKEREVTKQDLPELIKTRDKYKIEVAREKRASLGSSGRVYVQFR